MSTIREAIEQHESSSVRPRTHVLSEPYVLMGVTTVARSLVDGINDHDSDNSDIESIDSDSDDGDNELLRIDQRDFQGQLRLVRNNAVDGRITPGGHELDADGWPVEPPIVLATPMPNIEVEPVIEAQVVLETPPRSTRVPVRRPNTQLVNSLTAAEERIRCLQRQKDELNRDNRNLRAGMRRNAREHRDCVERHHLVIDDLTEENERLRKRIKLLEEADEFPLTGTEDTDFPITCAEKDFTGNAVIDLTDESE